MKRKTGNTLLEYSLIGSLIALGCVAGLLGAGKNFAAIISDLKADMANHKQVALVANSNAKLMTSMSSSSSSPGGLTTTLSQQEQMLLEQPLADKLQTTGANGTTELLAKQLELLATQLLAEGKITDAQSDIILRLSNQGHRMAQMEQLIEQGIQASNSDTSQLKNMTVTLDGQSYLISDLPGQIGIDQYRPMDFANGDILSDYASYRSPEMEKFITLYQQVVASGAASDPLVASTIRSSVTQIASVAETVEDNMWYAINETDQYGLSGVSDLNSRLASEITQINSSYICKAGHFSDSGLLCSP
jgi:hypothetical protein